MHVSDVCVAQRVGEKQMEICDDREICAAGVTSHALVKVCVTAVPKVHECVIDKDV